MIFERIKSEGLAHNSYIIGSGSEATIIDPRRDSQIYIERTRNRGLKIQYILETHRNEDYLIGSLELAEFTRAPIYHGPRPDWKYGNIVEDGQEFEIGKLRMKIIHTPGHTEDSLSYVLTDRSTGDAPIMVFTGDALFVGDTGRVDLYGSREVPRMAASLYDSIFNKILPLGESTIICPAHGGGSICGINIANRDESTLGIEKAQNPALQVKSKEDFIKLKIAEHPEKPPYFSQMEKYNVEGPPFLKCFPVPAPLTPQEFRNQIAGGAIVVDTSEPAAFGGAHIQGSYSIWLEGLPSFAGWLLPYDRPILLVLEEQGDLEKAVRYLIRVGYDNIVGFLKDGIEGWYNAGFPTESLPLLSVHQLKKLIEDNQDLVVLDARGQEEWNTGHIKGSIHVYVGHVEKMLDEIPGNKPIAVICSVGHRAGIAASILLRANFRPVFNVLGSVTAWKAAGFPLVKK